MIVFILFSLLPGLAYQWVQDDIRPLGAEDPRIAYLLGIAPNALGGLSLTVALGVVVWDLSGGRLRPLFIGAFALAGLWTWEAAQLWLPSTFDVHDLAWTVPGVSLGVLVLRALMPSNPRAVRPDVEAAVARGS
jgi:hypothetical protein